MYPYELCDRFRHGFDDFPGKLYYLNPASEQYTQVDHWHTEWEMVHVLKGSMTVSINNQTYHLQADDVLLVWEGMLHGWTVKNCIYESFVFDLRGMFHNAEPVKRELLPIFNMDILPMAHYQQSRHPFVTRMVSMLMEAASNPGYAKSSPNHYRLMVVGCLCSIFSYIMEKKLYTKNNRTQQEAENEWSENVYKLDAIRPVLSYIENNYQSLITMEDLTNIAGVNQNAFYKTFKEITQQTPMDYVIAYRVEQATNLLTSSDLPVMDIAMACGFNNYSYFIRTFKRNKGVTPNQYRISAKNSIQSQSKLK